MYGSNLEVKCLCVISDQFESSNNQQLITHHCYLALFYNMLVCPCLEEVFFTPRSKTITTACTEVLEISIELEWDSLNSLIQLMPWEWITVSTVRIHWLVHWFTEWERSTLMHWNESQAWRKGFGEKTPIRWIRVMNLCHDGKGFTDSNISKQKSSCEFWSKWFTKSNTDLLNDRGAIIVKIETIPWLQRSYDNKRGLNLCHNERLIHWLKRWSNEQQMNKPHFRLRGFAESNTDSLRERGVTLGQD